MIYFVIVLSLIVALLLLYLLIFVRPRANKPNSTALLCRYAHRGLHSQSIPENSLEAFGEAVSRGYGIELDVQLSRDGKVMVFHDYTLNRMTGVDKKLRDLTADELQNLRLGNTEQTIPTLSQVLKLVDGRVPLLIELKGESLDDSLCSKVAQLLKEYKGEYCIESFNPLLLRSIGKHLPDAFTGQLYTNVCRDKQKYTPLNVLLTLMAFNFLARPDFIAYNQKDRRSLPVILTTRLYKATKFVWTVKNDEELEKATNNRECAIFEEI